MTAVEDRLAEIEAKTRAAIDRQQAGDHWGSMEIIAESADDVPALAAVVRAVLAVCEDYHIANRPGGTVEINRIREAIAAAFGVTP